MLTEDIHFQFNQYYWEKNEFYCMINGMIHVLI